MLFRSFSAEKEPGAAARAKSRARWVALRWIEALLSSALVPPGPKRTAIFAAWSGYLATEENAGLWKELPAGHRDSCLKRLESLRSKGKETPGEE